MTGKEMDEAISVWLSSNGFTAEKYDITTKVVVGRGEGAAGTRVECQLEPKTEPVRVVAPPPPVFTNNPVTSTVVEEEPDQELEQVKPRSPFARD